VVRMSGHHVTIDDLNIGAVKHRLAQCTQLLETYEWLINSFVLDYFLESHWPHLPRSWQSTLSNSSPASLASLLDPESTGIQETVWPLSLLAFKQSIHHLSLARQPVEDFRFAQEFTQTQNSSHKHDVKRQKVNHSTENQSSAKPSESAERIEMKDVTTNRIQDSVLKDAQNLHIDTQQQQQQQQHGVSTAVHSFKFYPDMFSVFSGHHLALKHIFRKHVKPKKQYELARLGKFTRDVLNQVNLRNLVDVGSGVGHLARYLAYAHNLQVACVDSNNDFTDSANKFDEQLEKSVRKLESYQGEMVLEKPSPPVHVNAYLSPDMDLHSFHRVLVEKLRISDGDTLRYGIIGLHTCGDLGPVLVKMFSQDEKACALISVGCCYMKIKQHFPMSQFLREHETSWRLTYTNAELACHAVEMYRDRLRAGEQDKLKVHCYRAVLEKELVTRDPNLRHSILKTVAKAHLLPFAEYASRAVSKLPVQIDAAEFDTESIRAELDSWWDVVTYYTLRLALAPVIETVVLLDRCVYLHENGYRSVLVPLFDPLLSPRNQLIFAHKQAP